ncbi:unnamed protein product [Lampetra fluviatilis]
MRFTRTAALEILSEQQRREHEHVPDFLALPPPASAAPSPPPGLDYGERRFRGVQTPGPLPLSLRGAFQGSQGPPSEYASCAYLGIIKVGVHDSAEQRGRSSSRERGGRGLASSAEETRTARGPGEAAVGPGSAPGWPSLSFQLLSEPRGANWPPGTQSDIPRDIPSQTRHSTTATRLATGCL